MSAAGLFELKADVAEFDEFVLSASSRSLKTLIAAITTTSPRIGAPMSIATGAIDFDRGTPTLFE
jgi:hypothetical protein